MAGHMFAGMTACLHGRPGERRLSSSGRRAADLDGKQKENSLKQIEATAATADCCCCHSRRLRSPPPAFIARRPLPFS